MYDLGNDSGSKVEKRSWYRFSNFLWFFFFNFDRRWEMTWCLIETKLKKISISAYSLESHTFLIIRQSHLWSSCRRLGFFRGGPSSTPVVSLLVDVGNEWFELGVVWGCQFKSHIGVWGPNSTCSTPLVAPLS